MKVPGLQAQRFLKVIPSDSINTPNPSSESTRGSATSTTSNKLVDSGATFTSTVKINDIIYNNTDNTIATVTAIDSDTTLSVSADVFASGEDYVIYRDKDNRGCQFYVGGQGDVVIVNQNGDEETFVEAIGFLPVTGVRVNSTSTTATDIIALW